MEEVVALLVRLEALRLNDGVGTAKTSLGRRDSDWFRQTGSMESCHRSVVEKSRMVMALVQESDPARSCWRCMLS